MRALGVLIRRALDNTFYHPYPLAFSPSKNVVAIAASEATIIDSQIEDRQWPPQAPARVDHYTIITTTREEGEAVQFSVSHIQNYLSTNNMLICKIDSSDAEDRVIVVEIGSPPRSFYLYESILIRHSDLFKTILDEQANEVVKGVIRLHDIEPDTCRLLTNSSYQSGFLIKAS